MKRIIVLAFSIFLSVIFLSGCTGKAEENKSDVKTYPVKITEVKKESYPISLEYEGRTGGSEVRKLSFKTSARISKVHVSKGQYVNKGDILVELDKTDVNFALDAAKSQMDAASTQYEKAVNGAQTEDLNKAESAVKNAQASYNYYKELYDNKEELYQKAALPKLELDGAKVQLDNSRNALNVAEQNLQQLRNGARYEDKQSLLAQLNTAKASYNSKANLAQDASMFSDINGYVVDVLCKEGELQASGYPVILLRSESQVITVGLSDNDVKKIEVGTKAQVKIGDLTSDGEVINIVQMADSQSGTFSAEVKLLNPIDNNKFFIGQIAKIYINVGLKDSIWIPISSILNDGEDYVYVVDGERVARKNVTLGDIHEDKVSVEGMNTGDKLIIEGMKNVKTGYKVTVK